ncbi:hypothetical protein RB595_000064 [Gaeumannomyces hyphopodioides]
MGDIPSTPGSANEFSATFIGAGHTDRQGQAEYSQSDPQFVFSSQFQHHQHQHAFALQYDVPAQPSTPGRGPHGPYNKSSMMHSLPPANFLPGQQRLNAPKSSGGSRTMLQVSPYVNSGAINSMPGPQYYMGQHGPMRHYYGAAMPATQQQQQDGMSSRANMAAYYQQQHGQAQYYYPTETQFGNNAPAMQPPMVVGQSIKVETDSRSSACRRARHNYATSGLKRKYDTLSEGYAIWIGNLPPQTDLVSLVYHVCKEAPGLESLFLISKSNCAFANFKDEQACVAAQHKIHDSKFQSVRLVSRLRKKTVEGASGVTAPTGPSASTPQSATSQEAAGDESSSAAPAAVPDGNPAASPPAAVGSASLPQKEKYFILKSLTVEAIERSVQIGIWATQSHNEKALNNAFRVAQNVFLIFSANKSGEYFGYARMTSQINEDPAAAIELPFKAQSVTGVCLPEAIPTESNEFMPRGSILDDSERGTIFWEAVLDEDADDSESSAGGEAAADGSCSSKSVGGKSGESKAWGKPFHLEWVSTSHLPFFRTRSLRNPWNSNKEIKIARDGTELEPSVGRRLTALFSARGQGAAATAVGPGMRKQQQMPIVPGYPPMRHPPYQQ